MTAKAMAMRAQLTDGQLVARCRQGDPEAWNELVERFSRYVYAIAAQAFKLPEHDAEDVFQEVFTRTYQHLDRLRDDSAIRPWLAQLTRNLCLDRLRSNGREEPAAVLDDTAADDEIEQLDEAFAVREALAQLSPECGEILDRFFVRDESYRTIGDALGLPGGTIASRISRCLRKLRDTFAGRSDAPPPSVERVNR
jgi:RNA polymerase sigma factor (sigma-70 family)